MLTKLFLYSLVTYGISNLFVFGSGPFKIFEWIRYYAFQLSNHLGQQLTCMMCLPWYIGIIASVINIFTAIPFTPSYLIFGTMIWWKALIIDSFYTSAVVWLIHNVEVYFENMSKIKNASTIIEENVINTEDITKDGLL